MKTFANTAPHQTKWLFKVPLMAPTYISRQILLSSGEHVEERWQREPHLNRTYFNVEDEDIEPTHPTSPLFKSVMSVAFLFTAQYGTLPYTHTLALTDTHTDIPPPPSHIHTHSPSLFNIIIHKFIFFHLISLCYYVVKYVHTGGKGWVNFSFSPN